MADLTRRADCHASGIVATFARVAIGELEPLNLCRHCLSKHAEQFIRIGAIVERLVVNGDCDTLVVRT